MNILARTEALTINMGTTILKICRMCRIFRKQHLIIAETRVSALVSSTRHPKCRSAINLRVLLSGSLNKHSNSNSNKHLTITTNTSHL